MKKQLNTSKKEAPEPTLNRLPIYWQYLKRTLEKGVLNISTPTISSELDFESTQIVKDFSFTGIKGKPKVGYSITKLIDAIEKYLGFDQNNEAFLVGAGKLGQALILYNNLQGFGIKVIAAFDSDENKVGNKIGDVSILHVSKLEQLGKELGATIGILCTPEIAAQNAAETIIKSGVKAIWNFTPAKLKLPEDVIIQDTSMYANVAILLRKLHG